ncbi:putative baseplate assembly protein [Amycolatopsis samaneae]|uniref:Baseplate assembly protein n=1 Tax=Amycolatopsis samaneae TaxID=664691 RepID=A0ABW5GFP7_9PSEU
MALEVPNLDNRTFDQLVAEAKRRIARYTPEWTDFNASDPGITLVELFAWLTEITLFQLNQVPELTYVKFLDLLGLAQAPAAPAVAELTFTATNGAGPVLVPARTQVSATGADGDPLVFETDQGLALVPYPLGDVVVDDGAVFTPVTEANDTDGVSFHPLGWIPQPGNAVYLGFKPPETPGPAQFPPELRMRVTLPAAASAGAPQRAGARVRPPDPPVRLVWEYLPRAGASWRRLNTYADDSGAFTREGYLTIAGPAADITAVADVADVAEKRYWLRVRVASGVYPAGHEPEIDGLTPNTTTARNLATVTDELLGVSDGSPNATVHTRRTPVASLTLEVRGDETHRWKRVPDFLAAGPDDLAYTLDEDSGTVTFGDGVRGLIPPADAEIVAVEYRYGGGSAGNVPAGAVNAPLSARPGVDTVTNKRPAAGGTTRQSLAELKREAPDLLRHQNRAVTARDYADLARRVGGVADAIALPVTHPDHPGVEVAGAVTVVIVADSDDPEPAPSGELIAAVCRDLEEVRLLATELYVSGPAFVPITVHASLTAAPYAAADAVALAAETAIKAFLGPLHRQPDGSRTARFESRFQPTGLYGALLAVPGVVAVTALDLVVDGRPVDDPRQPVPLPPGGLPVNGAHRVDVRSEVS